MKGLHIIYTYIRIYGIFKDLNKNLVFNGNNEKALKFRANPQRYESNLNKSKEKLNL